MAEGSRPPQTFALMAGAGVGAFIGTILAFVVIKVMVGTCCCTAEDGKKAAHLEEPAAYEYVLPQRDA